MTVSSVTNRVSYTGNGSTTAFAFSHPFRLTADLVVTVRTTATGAESLKTEGSDYTVSGTSDAGTGGYSSGTVTFGTAPATGTQIHIDRVVTRTQTADFISGDGIPPASIEGALDKLSLSVQELDARFARTLLQPRTAANRNLALPEPTAANINQVLSVNAAGTAYQLTSQSSPTIPTYINVKDYGAVGDGTTDDTAAINAAFAAIRTAVDETDIYSPSYFVVFPYGNYKVTSSINATGIRNLIWGIIGPGRILGQTSGVPVLDLTYSRYCTIRDLHVFGSATNSPNIGILVAVDNSGNVSDVHYLDNVSISGTYTTACLYNYGSEDLTAIKLVCYNLHNSASSYCAVFTGHNSLSATSSFKTINANTAVSFNDVAVIHGDFRKAVAGPAILMEKASGLALHDCYGVSLNDAVVVVNKPSSDNCNLLHLDIHCEAGPSMVACVEFRGGSQDVYGFTFKDFAPQASTSVFRNGTGATAVTLRGVDIHISGFQVAPASNVFSTAGAFTIHGGTVYIGNNTYNNITSLAAFTGIIETDTLGRFVARTSFDVNGTKVLGARDTGWTAMTGSTDKSTSYATGSVTLAQLAGRVMALQAALTTHGIIGS